VSLCYSHFHLQNANSKIKTRKAHVRWACHHWQCSEIRGSSVDIERQLQMWGALGIATSEVVKPDVSWGCHNASSRMCESGVGNLLLLLLNERCKIFLLQPNHLKLQMWGALSLFHLQTAVPASNKIIAAPNEESSHNNSIRSVQKPAGAITMPYMQGMTSAWALSYEWHQAIFHLQTAVPKEQDNLKLKIAKRESSK